MKIPPVILRRFEWRLGLRSHSARLPTGMTLHELESALASLPADVDPEELLEYIEADTDAGHEPASPLFRERLRRLLWSSLGNRQALSSSWARLLN